MASSTGKTLPYKRSHFSTQLPVDYRYSPSHAWAVERRQGLWRVGFTRFATRMLGEMVDHGFETRPGETVPLGHIVGWVEGFKAISDLFSIVAGEFVAGNAQLKDQITLITRDPYGAGWLYEIQGKPDSRCMEVRAYAALLDQTIDRLLEKQQQHADQ